MHIAMLSANAHAGDWLSGIHDCAASTLPQAHLQFCAIPHITHRGASGRWRVFAGVNWEGEWCEDSGVATRDTSLKSRKKTGPDSRRKRVKSGV